MKWTAWDDLAVQVEVVQNSADKLVEAWGLVIYDDGSVGPIRTRLDKILGRNKWTVRSQWS